MPYTPTRTEGTAAASVHGASIFFPFVAPIVGLVLAGRSEFVRSHSMQALKEAILAKVLVLMAVLASACFTLYRLFTLYLNDWKGVSVGEFLFRAVIGWTVLWLFALITNVFSVRQAVRAYRGEWPLRYRA